MSQLRILLLDDDPEVYRIVRDLLSSSGSFSGNVDWCKSIEEAACKALSSRHDLWLLTYCLGVHTLTGFVEKIRQQTDPPPIIFLTGIESAEGQFSGQDRSAYLFLDKRVLGKIVLEGTIRYALAQRQHTQDLSRKAHWYDSVLSAIPDGIVVLDHQDRIELINGAARHLLGLKHDDQIQAAEIQNVLTAALTKARKQINTPAAERGISKAVEIVTRGAKGELIIASINAREIELDGTSKTVCSVRDVTQQKQEKTQLKRQAFIDPLTGLPNRKLGLQRLVRSMNTAQRDRHIGAILFIDLDRFKQLNDSLGHDVGDLLLRQTAARLTASVRIGDTVARMGGDEFFILLPALAKDAATATKAAVTLAEKIRLALTQPYLLNGRSYHSSSSIGIALFPDSEGATPEDLVKHSDEAMYQAKHVGRNQVCVYQPQIGKTASTRFQLEADLRMACERNELRVHFQPQHDVNGIIIGAEALLRWKRGNGPLLGPNEFISIAEDVHLIHQIGRWTLDTSLFWLKKWQDGDLAAANFSMAVNISPLQLQEPSFVQVVLRTIEQHGIDPRCLTLEITESILLIDMERVVNSLTLLQEAGISIALDDFGTGFSSLSHLRLLPLRKLKIDKSFVRDLNTTVRDQTLVETIISIGRNLQVDVIAEGVESSAALDMLKNMGCRYFQGFHLGKPLSPARFQKVLRDAYCHARIADRPETAN